MARLKSYTCSKCAGVLVFDGDQEYFDCPFCGTRFDVLDFHGDEVMDQAKSLLKNKFFDAAREKYQAVLNYDPKNFEAHLGVVLCELNITSASCMEDPDSLPEYDVVKVRKAILNAKKNSDKREAQYFSMMYELINIKEEEKKLKNEQKEISDDETSRKLNDKLVKDHLQDENGGRRGTITFICIFLYLVFAGTMLKIFVDNNFDRDSWNALVILIPIAVVVVAHVILNWLFKLADMRYKPVRDMERSYNGKIRVNNYDYSTAYSKLMALYPAGKMIKKLKERESVPASNAPVKDEYIDPSDIVICSKCAAKLVLNKEKRVYQCDHCGVAYGISLFFGLPMEKALNALNTGFYDDADQRFSGILMAHPSDFEALLGRVLCEGGWTKISDIDLTDDVDESSFKEAQRRLEEAKQHSSVHNVTFFENVEKLIGYCKEYRKAKEKIDEVDREVKAFDANTTVMNEAFHGKNFRLKREKERNELLSKAYPFQVSNKKIEIEFRELRSSITAMRDDSVLCK